VSASRRSRLSFNVRPQTMRLFRWPNSSQSNHLSGNPTKVSRQQKHEKRQCLPLAEGPDNTPPRDGWDCFASTRRYVSHLVCVKRRPAVVPIKTSASIRAESACAWFAGASPRQSFLCGRKATHRASQLQSEMASNSLPGARPNHSLNRTRNGIPPSGLISFLPYGVLPPRDG